MTWIIIYFFVLIIAILIGLKSFMILSNSCKLCLLLLLSTICAEAIGYFVASILKTNFIVYHIFTPLQCITVLFAYYTETKDKFFVYLIPVVTFLALILSFWVQPLPAYNTYFMDVELILFTIISSLFFKKLLSLETDLKLYQYPFFWISCGLLIFSVLNIFIFGSFNFIIKSNTIPNKILISVLTQVRFVTNYIYYSSFIVAFLVKQNTISDQHGK